MLPMRNRSARAPVDPTSPILAISRRIVRIVGAFVNDTSSPEHETVTLLNTADVPVDLAGWAILDRAKHRQLLEGSIGASQTRKIALDGTVSNAVQLSNKGGVTTLVNAEEVKVHGVS